MSSAGFCASFCHADCCGHVYDERGEFNRVNTCEGKKVFRGSQSTTLKERDDWFLVRYGTGDARGRVAVDDVTIGGAALNLLKIRQVSIFIQSL